MVFDEQAFTRFYTDWQRRFVRFACSYVCDERAAEDIVADAMAYYWENRRRLPQEANVPAYVMTAVKHGCVDYLRRKQCRQDIEDHITHLSAWNLSVRLSCLDSLNPHEVFSNEIVEMAEAALASLPERTREIFIRCRYENKSHKEVADSFGITVKGVEFHLSKATSSLKSVLKDYLPAYLLLYFIH